MTCSIACFVVKRIPTFDPQSCIFNIKNRKYLFLLKINLYVLKTVANAIFYDG